MTKRKMELGKLLTNKCVFSFCIFTSACRRHTPGEILCQAQVSVTMLACGHTLKVRCCHAEAVLANPAMCDSLVQVVMPVCGHTLQVRLLSSFKLPHCGFPASFQCNKYAPALPLLSLRGTAQGGGFGFTIVAACNQALEASQKDNCLRLEQNESSYKVHLNSHQTTLDQVSQLVHLISHRLLVFIQCSGDFRST